MTQVLIKTNSKRGVLEIISGGHSGYAESGADIVCSALSSALELVMNMFDAFDVKFSLECDEDIPAAHITVDLAGQSAIEDSVKRIVKGYREFVGDICREYPEYAQIITEV